MQGVLLLVFQPCDVDAATDISSLLSLLLGRYVQDVSPHVRQAACVWLLAITSKCSRYSELQTNVMHIQDAFISLLSEADGNCLFSFCFLSVLCHSQCTLAYL